MLGSLWGLSSLKALKIHCLYPVGEREDDHLGLALDHLTGLTSLDTILIYRYTAQYIPSTPDVLNHSLLALAPAHPTVANCITSVLIPPCESAAITAARYARLR